MRAFHGKVEVVSPGGDHVRFVPGHLARAMVAAEIAAIHNANGKVKSIRLVETASSHAQRIGEPQGRATGVRFTRIVHLDESASRIFEFHPRSVDYE